MKPSKEEQEKTAAVLAKSEETRVRWMKKLTKPQRKLFDLIYDEGCYVVIHFWNQPVIMRPDGTVVGKTYHRTISALQTVYVRETLLGKDGEFGRIYAAHEDLSMIFIMRSCDIAERCRKKKLEAKKRGKDGKQE